MIERVDATCMVALACLLIGSSARVQVCMARRGSYLPTHMIRSETRIVTLGRAHRCPARHSRPLALPATFSYLIFARELSLKALFWLCSRTPTCSHFGPPSSVHYALVGSCVVFPSPPPPPPMHSAEREGEGEG